MSLSTRTIRVISCDAPNCNQSIESTAMNSTSARIVAHEAGWGYRPTERKGPKTGSIPLADFCPSHREIAS